MAGLSIFTFEPLTCPSFLSLSPGFVVCLLAAPSRRRRVCAVGAPLARQVGHDRTVPACFQVETRRGAQAHQGHHRVAPGVPAGAHPARRGENRGRNRENVSHFFLHGGTVQYHTPRLVAMLFTRSPGRAGVCARFQEKRAF